MYALFVDDLAMAYHYLVAAAADGLNDMSGVNEL